VLAASAPGNGGICSKDEVDIRAEVVKPGARKYPEDFERAGLGGTATLEYVIDSLGKIDPNSLRTVQATTSPLEAAALAMLLTARFLPADKRAANGLR
jgi:TonB family protein